MDADRGNETVAERADRNFGDLLQELRVVQTGVQILFAFLLTMPLQARYETLDRTEIGLLVAALLLTAGATICLIAPVAHHRVLFQQQMKEEVVRSASRFAMAGLGFLGLAVVCSVELVLDLVLGRLPALGIGVGLLIALSFFWVLLPLRMREDRSRQGRAALRSGRRGE